MSRSSAHLATDRREAGSILVVALLTMGILALIASAALYQVGNRHATTFHSLSWHESLVSAETGVDLAVRAISDSIAAPGTAWTDWTPNDASTFPKTWTPTLTPHLGEGNTKVFTTMTVDNAITDVNGLRWFRIRSRGVAEIAGTCRAGIEGALLDTSGVKNHRGLLRKVRFSGDLTGGALRLPQIARSIEVMAAPVNSRLLIRGLTLRREIGMSGNSFIDSFDSSDPAKSTGGLYDYSLRLARGDIGSNAAGSLSNLNGREVLGNASTNGGTIGGAGNVQGMIFDNFSTVIPAVATPSWPTINVLPNTINNPAGGMTLVGGPAGAPQSYKVSDLNVLTSANPLILAPHTPGVESYVNIWVTGAMSVSGNGYIQQQPGVHLTIYCEGNITVTGGGVVNQTGRARNLQIFGVDPASGTRSFTIGGNGNFIGVLDAPAFDLTISGTGDFSGSAVARSAALTGTGGFHYDESLSSEEIGPANSYQVVSWIEDVR